jgi:hypothetical protein
LVGKELVRLRVSACSGFTSGQFQRVLKGCRKSIKQLVVSSNYWVDDDVVRVLGECEELEFVDLSACPRVTFRGLDTFKEKRGRRWKYINIGDNTGISNDSVKRLQEQVGRSVVTFTKDIS